MSGAVASPGTIGLELLEVSFDPPGLPTFNLPDALTVRADLVDQLFLTRSPVIVGRRADKRALSLLKGGDLLSVGAIAATLLTLRRAGSHLFLRYALPQGRGLPPWEALHAEEG